MSDVGESSEVGASTRSEAVEVQAAGVALPGDLLVPSEASGVVIFAHGSGSSRHSPRNRQIAATLNDAGFATLLFDLLTPEEEQDRGLVFDIPFLARRLIAATRWTWSRPDAGTLPVGYFGASTGAAAALWAAADLGAGIGAVVSRGGRPDLAAGHLSSVTAPTLLVVGELDVEVLALNEQARRRMTCESALEVVPGATHLFEEPGTLEEVATLATDWFVRHLPAR